MKPRLKNLSWMPSVTSGELGGAASCCGDVFNGRDWKTSQDWGKDERSKIQRDPWWKPAPERSGPQTGTKIHLPTAQRSYVNSQVKAGVASGQVSEFPWVAQPELGLEPDRTSLERPENSCAKTLPIEPDRAWEDLQKGMGETPQIQLYQACSITPK